MIREKTDFGMKIIIPETPYNCEFVYRLRMVKVLNRGLKHHPSIEGLSKREEKLIRQFVLRVHSMENFFKQIPRLTYRCFDIWEAHNRMNWNEYYHDGLRDLKEMIDDISSIYHDNCTEGYPYHKYSCRF